MLLTWDTDDGDFMIFYLLPLQNCFTELSALGALPYFDVWSNQTTADSVVLRGRAPTRSLKKKWLEASYDLFVTAAPVPL